MPEVRKRGRPLKFGRPARSLAVTLPEDVISTLRAVDADLGRAIVALAQQRTSAARTPRLRRNVDVARTSGQHSLIVVDPAVVPGLPGCHLMRIGDHRAFITLGPGAGLADLEVAVLDRIAESPLDEHERVALRELRRAVKQWRTDRRVNVYPRTVVVLEDGRARHTGASILSPLGEDRRARRLPSGRRPR